MLITMAYFIGMMGILLFYSAKGGLHLVGVARDPESSFRATCAKFNSDMHKVYSSSMKKLKGISK